ncbi:MAG: hypothetical protein ACOC1F_08940 [Myxococcota bacterium]
MRVGGLQPPTDQKKRRERIAYLRDIIKAWNAMEPALKTDEVRERGSELAAKLEDRKQLLARAQFVQPAKAPPEGRKRLPAETHTGSGLGDDEKLSDSHLDRLRTNGEAIERLRTELIQWCTDDE